MEEARTTRAAVNFAVFIEYLFPGNNISTSTGAKDTVLPGSWKTETMCSHSYLLLIAERCGFFGCVLKNLQKQIYSLVHSLINTGVNL